MNQRAAIAFTLGAAMIAVKLPLLDTPAYWDETGFVRAVLKLHDAGLTGSLDSTAERTVGSREAMDHQRTEAISDGGRQRAPQRAREEPRATVGVAAGVGIAGPTW